MVMRCGNQLSQFKEQAPGDYRTDMGQQVIETRPGEQKPFEDSH